MLCAHMDEIGAMVFAIEKDGRLRFRKSEGLITASWSAKRCASAPRESRAWWDPCRRTWFRGRIGKR